MNRMHFGKHVTASKIGPRWIVVCQQQISVSTKPSRFAEFLIQNFPLSFDCSATRYNPRRISYSLGHFTKVLLWFDIILFKVKEKLVKMSSEALITDKQIASAQAKIDARKRFESVFPLLVDEATTYLRSIHLPENAIEWYKQVRFNKRFDWL
jgi:hypothetical protein